MHLVRRLLSGFTGSSRRRTTRTTRSRRGGLLSSLFSMFRGSGRRGVRV